MEHMTLFLSTKYTTYHKECVRSQTCAERRFRIQYGREERREEGEIDRRLKSTLKSKRKCNVGTYRCKKKINKHAVTIAY